MASLGWIVLALLVVVVFAFAILTRHWVGLRNELSQRVSELSTVERVGQAIAQAELDVDEICTLMYDHIHEISDATIFHLGLFDGDSYTPVLWIREGRVEPQQTFQLTPGKGLVNWLRQSGRSILVRDFEKEQDSLPAQPVYVSDHPPRSALFVPLMAGEAVIGTLSIQSYEPNAYGDGDLRVLSALANQAAVAIQKARLYEGEQQQAWLSTVLLQVADATSRLSDMEDLLTTIVRLVPLLVGVDRCAVLLWEPDVEIFAPAQAYGLSPELKEAFDHMLLSPKHVPALELIRRDPSPRVIDMADGRGLFPQDLAETFDIQQMNLLPLWAQGQLLGVMMVDYAGKPHRFSRRHLDMLTGIASQAATGIHSARLVQAQKEETYISLALLQVAETVSRSTDLAETMAAIVRITPMLVGVEACAIFLWDPGAGAFLPFQQYGLNKEIMSTFQELHLPGSDPAVAELLNGAPFIRLDGLSVDVPFASVADGASLLLLPLVTRGEIVGGMLVEYRRPVQHFAGRWAKILTGIADQAAVAVENDRLLQEAAEQERVRQELELARRIQTSFLPEQCPDAPGWQFAAVWRSARQVGGDFYDFIPLPPQVEQTGRGGDRLGMVIADVADKGVPAALFMALSRTLVRTVAIDGRPPSKAIARANDLILADARAELFVTLFYTILQLDSGEITYVNAGHMPPLLLRRGEDAVEELHTGGMALGVLPGIEFEQCKAYLSKGDALILYTDGVIEATNAEQEMFGRERLIALATEHRTQSARELAQLVDETVAAYVGGAPQFDDFTLVVAKREQ